MFGLFHFYTVVLPRLSRHAPGEACQPQRRDSQPRRLSSSDAGSSLGSCGAKCRDPVDQLEWCERRQISALTAWLRFRAVVDYTIGPVTVQPVQGKRWAGVGHLEIEICLPD